ncbi:MAG: LamG domain-containing protein [Planctomycetota bacterium]|nr:MAG: LamG domain-containing protein [Planctomycetota bacterium]
MRLSLVIAALLGLLALFGSAEANDANLVAYWAFDEGSGTVAYDSAGGNDGTFVGEPSWTTGQIDGALEFDGENDYISCGTGPALTGMGPFSVSAWVKTDIVKGHAIVVQRGPGSANNGMYGVSILADGRAQFGVYNSGHGFTCRSSVIVYDGLWHHVAAVRTNSTDGKIYVDGSLSGSDSGPARSLNSLLPVWIGGPGFTGPFRFEGKIDEVMIFNRALSDAEVEELYWKGFSSVELAIMEVEDALAEKESALEVIDAALEKELVAYEALDELLDSKDYGDLSKGDIIKARQGIHSAMQHQEQSADALERGVEQLGDALLSLGVGPEAEIVYEVLPCDMNSAQPKDFSETRFSVTVKGSYIYFEDMVTANCCTDEVELQMELEDNLITIYEIEHTTMWCLCICDYPATATLGPFEPGTYTVEVYEEYYGGFIGSTTVTIGPEKGKKDVKGLLKAVRTPKPKS